MKRVLIYAPDSLESDDLRCLHALAHRLLAANDSVSICVVGETRSLPPKGAAGFNLHSVVLPTLRELTLRREADGTTARVPMTVALARRTELIQQTLVQFAPDLLIVDQLPLGRYDELGSVFAALDAHKSLKRVLLLRDFMGTGEEASAQWSARGYFDAIANHYDRVLVLGDRSVFDLELEYHIPPAAASKLSYCGYLHAEMARSDPERVRRALGVAPGEPLVLVRAGPGRGGEDLVRSTLAGLAQLPARSRPRTHILCGDGMRESERLSLACAAHALPQVTFQHLSRDALSLIMAADVIITDARYQSASEILPLRKRAVMVLNAGLMPQEAIRARRLAARGLARAVPQVRMEPNAIMMAMLEELIEQQSSDTRSPKPAADGIDFATSTMLGLIDLVPGPRALPPSGMAQTGANELRLLDVLGAGG